jgi:hypothetical protein
MSAQELQQRMLAWAARARSNPRFEMEEREFRLTVAGLAREALAAAARGEPVAGPVEALHGFMRPRVPELVVPRHLEQLLGWAREDEPSLAAALGAFNDLALAPGERVARFARSFQERRSADDGVGLIVGSLFAFATAPGKLPVVRAAVFERLEELFGERAPAGSIADRHARHVEFAHRMLRTLAAAGVEASDMLDTEALMLICWEDHEFWADDDDGRRPRTRPPDHYLAACAIYRDEADHLAEWIEFHRLVGFERFYLYDNLSTDHHLDVLEPYIAKGLVVAHEWPRVPGQISAYDHCLSEHGEEARWIGFFDIDEFLFSPTLSPVPEVLGEFEQWPGVCVNVPRFGTSGHRTKPDGLVIESYVMRLQVPAERTVKSVVDPYAVERCRNSHQFFYRRRAAVDEHGYPVHNTATKSASFARLRVNHYYSKSEAELRAKHAARTADYSRERRALPDSVELARHEAEVGVRDEAILPYVEAVRDALARRAPARRSV